MTDPDTVETPKRRKTVGNYVGTPKIAERWVVSEDTTLLHHLLCAGTVR